MFSEIKSHRSDLHWCQSFCAFLLKLGDPYITQVSSKEPKWSHFKVLIKIAVFPSSFPFFTLLLLKNLGKMTLLVDHQQITFDKRNGFCSLSTLLPPVFNGQHQAGWNTNQN